MLMLAACLGSDSADSVQGSWVLESGTLHGEPLELLASHPVTLDLGEDTVGGTAACNGYQGEYRVSGPDFEIVEGLAVTEMACGPEEIMTTERRYLDALLAADTVSLDNGMLILSGAGSDVELIFTILEPAPVGDLVDTVWVLESLIEGDAVASVGGERAMLILHPDGTFEGSTGCRSIAGDYTVSGAEVVFTSWGAEGECPADLVDQDGVVVAVLGDGFRAEVDGAMLTLWSRGDQGLVYRAGS